MWKSVTVPGGRYDKNSEGDWDWIPTPPKTGSIAGSVRMGAINTFDEEEVLQRLILRLGKKPLVQHKCHNCGATVELDSEKHIFVCRYCGSAYAVGSSINDKI